MILVVWTNGLEYQAMGTHLLHEIPHGVGRVTMLEIIKSFNSNALYCPTVSYSKCKQEIHLVYDSWTTNKKFRIKINGSRISYAFSKGNWLDTNLIKLKHFNKEIGQYLCQQY